MKKIILLFIFTLFYSIANAQLPISVEGNIVYSNGKKEKVLLKIHLMPSIQQKSVNFLPLQRRITCINTTTDEYYIEPSDETVKEVHFTIDNQIIYIVNEKHPEKKNKRIFLHRVINGSKLSLFRYYNPGQDGNQSVYFILRKKQEHDFYIVESSKFRKKMAQYFEDCPELSSKITSKEFKKKHIEQIVNFYNENCKDKKQHNF